MARLSSDLDLHGDAPERVRPRLGHWGPTMVPSTRAKRRQRVVVAVVTGVATLVLVTTWVLIYLLMTGRLGG